MNFCQLAPESISHVRPCKPEKHHEHRLHAYTQQGCYRFISTADSSVCAHAARAAMVGHRMHAEPTRQEERTMMMIQTSGRMARMAEYVVW